MKRFAKYVLSGALIAGAATIAALPASAAVRIGVGIAPYAAGPGPVCDPYSRFYDPYYCGAPYYGPGYYGGPGIGFGFCGGWHGGHGFPGGGGFHGGGHAGGGGHHR